MSEEPGENLPKCSDIKKQNKTKQNMQNKRSVQRLLSQKPMEMRTQRTLMRSGAAAMPSAAEKSWVRHPAKHPFDLACKRLLVILTRPQ